MLFHKVGDDEAEQLLIARLLPIFQEESKVLVYIVEKNDNRTLRLFDLKLLFQEDNICWQYSSKSKKAPLPYASANS